MEAKESLIMKALEDVMCQEINSGNRGIINKQLDYRNSAKLQQIVA